jgi:hypothetical protein
MEVIRAFGPGAETCPRHPSRNGEMCTIDTCDTGGSPGSHNGLYEDLVAGAQQPTLALPRGQLGAAGIATTPRRWPVEGPGVNGPQTVP